MLPTWQTVGLLVKETEQLFPGLGSRNACSGQGVSCHKQVLPESLGRCCSANKWEMVAWLETELNLPDGCVWVAWERQSHSLEVMLLSQQWAHLGGDWEIGSSCWQCWGRAGGEGSTSHVSWGHPLGWLLLATEFGRFCFYEFYSRLMPMFVDLDTIEALFFSC